MEAFVSLLSVAVSSGTVLLLLLIVPLKLEGFVEEKEVFLASFGCMVPPRICSILEREKGHCDSVGVPWMVVCGKH